MDRYPRRFILASLVYLALGVTMGALMAAGLVDQFAWRFVHLHLNLLGFMSMIVAGVAYHVLPRFNGRPVKHPRLIAVHFWLANLGLAGMTVTRGLAAAGGGETRPALFPLFAVVSAVGGWIFVWNLFPVLMERRAAARHGHVDPRMKVSEVLARWPSSLEVFRRWGFAALANPAARATFAKLVTVEKACRIHKVDLSGFIAALNGATEGKGVALPLAPPSVGGCEEVGRTFDSARDKGRLVGGEEIVGEVLRKYPASRAVLERFFGPDCFSCPGQVQETLAQSASMHGVDRDELLDAVDRALRPPGGGGGR